MADASVISCGHCAQPNWVPASWDLRALGCTRCGLALTGSAPRRSGAALFKMAGALCAAAAIWFIGSKYWPTGISKTAYAPVQSMAPAKPPPVPVAPPHIVPPPPPVGGERRPDWAIQAPAKQTPAAPTWVPIADGLVRATKGKNRVVPIRIKGAPNSDYFVKIVGATNGEEIAVLFVKGGNTITETMPLGTYQLRFASGKTWYGEPAKFGSLTQYWVADQKLVFRREGNRPQPVSITITPERGGSLKIRLIESPRF